MKKICIALACLAFGGVASAITIGWQWTPNDMSLVSNSSYYMVYSANGGLSAEQVVALASGGEYGKTDKTAIGSTWGSTLDSSKVDTTGITASVTPGVGNDPTGVGYPYGGVAQAQFDDPTFPGSNVAGTSGYLYFVIFNDETISGSSQFAVAKAPTTVTVNDKAQVVEGGQIPDALEFQAPVWLGGTHQAAPEPTALALLALGIAGVALRRRVR